MAAGLVTRKKSDPKVETSRPPRATHSLGEEPAHGSPEEDARLVELARAASGGDERALEALVERFERPLRILGSRLLGESQAEDLAQEAFFRMLKALKSFRGESRFSTWLFGIAYHTALGMRRKSRRSAEDTSPLESALEARAPGDPSETQALRDAVEWALARIRPQHRDAVVLHYLRELSLAEVAMVMKVPEATVKVYLFRGRQELYRVLEKEGGFTP